MYPELTDAQLTYITDAIRAAVGRAQSALRS